MKTHEGVSEIITSDGVEHSMLIVPIVLENTMYGVVVLHKSDTQPFTDDEIDLAGRVVNRAAVTIDNARLYTAVQAADRAKSEFVGIVAHELKTPMTSIQGYASLTKMMGEENKSLLPRQGEFIDKITDMVKRMEVLVSDLADISRIESGHFSMEPIRVPVQRIVDAVRDTTIQQIDERDHSLVLNVEENLPDMFVDYYRLLQVLTNFVSNAYKYTPNGGTITLSAVKEVKDNRIRFTVKDTGIGLSRSQLAKLGTKFWRAEDDYTRAQQGTGLGFAITRNLVHLMGSQIEIESEPGEGSAFTFSVEIAPIEIHDDSSTQPV